VRIFALSIYGDNIDLSLKDLIILFDIFGSSVEREYWLKEWRTIAEKCANCGLKKINIENKTSYTAYSDGRFEGLSKSSSVSEFDLSEDNWGSPE